MHVPHGLAADLAHEEVIQQESRGQRYRGDAEQVDRGRTSSQAAGDRADGDRIGGRPRQQKDQGRPGTDSLEQQRRRNGRGRCGAHIQWNAHGQHEEHRKPGAIGTHARQQTVGHQHGDQGGQEHAQHQ